MDFNRLSHVVPNLRTISTPDGPVVAPQKAYRNVQWLTGSSGKAVRILSEFIEPTERLDAAGVRNTILVFGSARARSPANYESAQKRLAEALAAPGLTPEAQAKLDRQKLHLDRQAWMAVQYDQIVELTRRLAEWSLRRTQSTGAPLYSIATGGGPGIMEAANKGASLVPGAINVGMGISLPFESGINPYVTPELSMEFHYFFMRKFVMCNTCRAFIAGAGGYGTFDELFEVLTLFQSGKVDFADLMPVVLFGVEFWKSVVNFDALLMRGVISEHDIDRLFFTDSVDDAFTHITTKLVQYEAAKAAKAAQDAEAARKNASAAAMAFNANLMRAREEAGSAYPDGLAVAGLPPGLSIHIARNPSLATLQQAHAEDGGDAFLETDYAGSGAGAMPVVGKGSAAAAAAYSGLESISEVGATPTPTPTPGSFSPPESVPAVAEKKKAPALHREFSSE